MKKIICLLALLFLAGCQSTSLPSTSLPLVGNKFTNPVEMGGVKFNVSEVESGVVSEIRFNPYNSLIDEVKTQSKNEVWSDERLNTKLSQIDQFYKYGRFHVIGYEYTIDAASDGYLKSILIQNGKVIQTMAMKGIAHKPLRYSGYAARMWWNSTILSPKELSLDEPFEIRVISTIGNSISRYVYTPVVVVKESELVMK